MNERIKQLVKQAGGHFSTHILTSYPAQRRESIELWDKNIEKFAELIVRECVDVANSKAEGIDLGSKLYLYKEDIEDTIKKHFGVEE